LSDRQIRIEKLKGMQADRNRILRRKTDRREILNQRKSKKVNVSFEITSATTETDVRMTDFGDFHGAITMRAARIREIEAFLTLSFRERESAFTFRTDETGNLNQRTIGSTTMIVSVDVDFSWMIAVRTARTIGEVGFTWHRVIYFREDGGGCTPL